MGLFQKRAVPSLSEERSRKGETRKKIIVWAAETTKTQTCCHSCNKTDHQKDVIIFFPPFIYFILLHIFIYKNTNDNESKFCPIRICGIYTQGLRNPPIFLSLLNKIHPILQNFNPIVTRLIFRYHKEKLER